MLDEVQINTLASALNELSTQTRRITTLLPEARVSSPKLEQLLETIGIDLQTAKVLHPFAHAQFDGRCLRNPLQIALMLN